MGYPQPPQYGPPPGMPPRPIPSSTSYVCAAIFGMFAGVGVMMGILETKHVEAMPDQQVVMWIFQLLAGVGMIAGSVVLLSKKFSGIFVFSGAAGVYLLTLILIPIMADMPLGPYIKMLGSAERGVGIYGVIVLISAIVAVSCGFASGTRRYINFANACRAYVMNNGMGYPQQVPQAMYPPQAVQQAYPQWGQQAYSQQPYPQQYPQQQYPQTGQQPQQWYPGQQ